MFMSCISQFHSAAQHTLLDWGRNVRPPERDAKKIEIDESVYERGEARIDPLQIARREDIDFRRHAGNHARVGAAIR